MSQTFVHLHLHSEYSLVDGTIRIPQLVEQTLQNQMPAVAITDIFNLYGAVKFYKQCQKQGIKPIIGAEVYIDNPENSTQPFSLVLLVQNDIGYRNLSHLLSRGFRIGQQFGKPRLQKEWLQNHCEGLIALSGGMQGELGMSILAKRGNKALSVLREYIALFGNRFYIEIQRVGKAYEEEYIAAAAQLASQEQVPLVASNDARFMRSEDFEAHEVRVCIDEGRVLSDTRRIKRYTEQQYYKSNAEMLALFDDIPSAIENTVLIAQRCNFHFTLGVYSLPDFPVPTGETVVSYLRSESEKGLIVALQKRFPQGATEKTIKEYQDRLKFEIDIIEKMGFPGYFLIVADFIRWAKENNIPVGPGRGSGAGSIVAYALGITDLDPIEHILLFERFLNPERVSMPDFDVDFCVNGREHVIEYVAQKYGRDKVSQIITFGTMAAKAVIRDVGRVLGMSYGHVDGIAKLIPFDLGMTLEKALAAEPELRQRYEEEEEVANLINMSLKLEGLSRNVGKHAGGVVIAPRDLTHFTPLYCENGSDQIVAQFDKDDLEEIGLVKFDFLGLKNLTVIDTASKAINQYRAECGQEPIDIEQIPLDDAETYQLLQQGKTTAIFQLESSGMKELIKNLRPDTFDDIVALVALYRPGPLGAGMDKTYCDRKHGREKTVFLHTLLAPILESTYGVMVYQEQVMEVARVMGGYSLGNADILRRAMGKKKTEEMQKQRSIFIAGAKERDVNAELAMQVFDLMEEFANYGFNKSHSAAYAIVSYRTAWLKQHYPAHFIASCMSADMESTEKVVVFLNEAEQMGIAVCHPCINTCEYFFSADGMDKIIYGLGAIKGIGEPVVQAIIEERKRAGAFSDLFDLCLRVGNKKLNRRALEALVRAGALDDLGAHRASLMASVDLALSAATQNNKNHEAGQVDIFGVDTRTQDSVLQYQHVAPWKRKDLLQEEKNTLGLFLSGHPIDLYLNELSQFTSYRLLDLDKDSASYKKDVTIAGLVVAVKMRNTKTGARMALLQLDDKSARFEIRIFEELYQQKSDIIHVDKILIVKGRLTINHFSDTVQMSASDIFDIHQARAQLARVLEVRLNKKQLEADAIHTLSTLLAPVEQGHCRLRFIFETEYGVCEYDSPVNSFISINKLLLEKLEEQIGTDNFVLRY